MIILAVDTASTSCSVSIVDGTSVLSEYMVNHKDTHSRFVMEMIHTMLAACRLRASDLDGIAVTTAGQFHRPPHRFEYCQRTGTGHR
ncbi:MAG: hypothetical protein R2874_01085 [Desulfobacterales bacterium]